MTKKKRRRFSGAEKVAILRRHLVDGEEVSSVCRSAKIQVSMFYDWQKRFFEEGAKAFEADSKQEQSKLQTENERLKAKLQRKDSVLGELMEEHIALKKSLGED